MKWIDLVKEYGAHEWLNKKLILWMPAEHGVRFISQLDNVDVKYDDENSDVHIKAGHVSITINKAGFCDVQNRDGEIVVVFQRYSPADCIDGAGYEIVFHEDGRIDFDFQ